MEPKTTALTSAAVFNGVGWLAPLTDILQALSLGLACIASIVYILLAIKNRKPPDDEAP